MDNRDDGGFDVIDNDFQEKSVTDRSISDEVSYDAGNVYVEPAIEFLERVNTYLNGEVRQAQMQAERILRDYARPDGFNRELVDADEAVELLEMEVEQARQVNDASGELDSVVKELETAYRLVQCVYEECDERNILAYGAV